MQLLNIFGFPSIFIKKLTFSKLTALLENLRHLTFQIWDVEIKCVLIIEMLGTSLEIPILFEKGRKQQDFY